MNKRLAENGIRKLSKRLVLIHGRRPIPVHKQCSLKQGSLYRREMKSALLAVAVTETHQRKFARVLDLRKHKATKFLLPKE